MRGRRLQIDPGDRFGRLAIRSEVPKRAGRRYFLCRCVCGTEKVVRLESLTSGAILSCGCLNREISRAANTKHGQYQTRLYRVWTGMRGRCLSPGNQNYDHYGGRGIRVCAEWDEFEAFRDWAMANGYRDDLTIDRIDNDGNYEPGNCTWIPAAEQRKNTTRVQRVAIGGKARTLRGWARHAGMHHSTLFNRLRSGWPLERAVSVPVRKKTRRAR